MGFDNFSTPHCHVKSLDSASTPEAFVERELELGTGTITVTDHGTLAGCQEVYELGRKKGLTPILGLEAYHRDDNDPILVAAGIPKNVDGKYSDYLKYTHITTHFLDQAAFQTGIKLLSKAPVERHGSEVKPLFDWAAIEELGASNTTFGTGCLIGMVARHLLAYGDPDMARKYFNRLKSCVRPGNLFVELFPHVCSHNWVQGVFIEIQEDGKEPQKLRFHAGKNFKTNVGEIKAQDLAQQFNKRDNKHRTLLAIKNYRVWADMPPATILSVKHVEEYIQNECTPWAPEGDVQLGVNKFMLELAKAEGIPALVSDDCHFTHPDEKIVQDMRLAQSGNWKMFGSYHRQSSDEAWAYFSSKMGVDRKTFEGWIDNSKQWAARFKSFRLEVKPELPVKFFESKYSSAGAKNSLAYTMHLINSHGRMNWNDPAYVARLEQEIELLYNNGTIDLLPYFMIDEEVCRLYRDNGMLTGPGRGSASGVLLTYLLGITHVDPLRYGLSLNRFINPDRIRSGKFPDIDQDLNDRDILAGTEKEVDMVRVSFDDGSVMEIPATQKMSTDSGPMTAAEAMSSGADVKL